MLKYDNDEIKLQYITIPAAVSKINYELNLPANRYINANHIYRWRSDKLVTQTFPHKLTLKEFERIKQITIMNVIVGIPISKILNVEDYIRRRNIEYRNQILNIIDSEESKPRLRLKIKNLYV